MLPFGSTTEAGVRVRFPPRPLGRFGALLGRAWRGMAWRGLARHGEDMERCWQTLGFESSGRTARIDALTAWPGKARQGMARHGKARYGEARNNKARKEHTPVQLRRRAPGHVKSLIHDAFHSHILPLDACCAPSQYIRKGLPVLQHEQAKKPMSSRKGIH